MGITIIPRDQVADRLGISAGRLVRYEARGLIRSVSEGAVAGYPPEELRRIWTVVSLQRDLGINLAGVEAVLKLRAHLQDVHDRVAALARELELVVEEAGPTDDDA